MISGRVNWSTILLCLVHFCCMECRSGVKNTRNNVSPAAQHDIESYMHPNFKTPNRPIKTNSPAGSSDDETISQYWQARGQQDLRDHLANGRNEKVAKNVIYFLGDGMSIPTITSARIYSGQLNGGDGEEAHLSFEEFPDVGLCKTYCIDRQVPDSACTATAYLGGIKANYWTIGVNGQVQLNDCSGASNPINQVDSLLALAQRAGKRTGIVTTTTVTHATPAGAYAHTPNRDFECDSDVVRTGNDPSVCVDIARQLIENDPGVNFNVIMGGGRSKFLSTTMTDAQGNVGQRADGRNLIDDWLETKENAQFIYDKNGLNALNIDTTDYVLGLFAPSHLDYHLDADPTEQPTLIEMTEAAINLLDKGDCGYFLFIEGGRIDQAHHTCQAVKALDETVEFSKAIQRAVDLTDPDDTLIIVTSDHAHTMSMAGYPVRGNPIIGLNNELSDADGLPTTTLAYANGPGYGKINNPDGTRIDLTGTVFDKNYVYPALFPMKQETHGGDDVAIFAFGCMSYLFTGLYEQSTIPSLVSYASCLGDGLTACNQFHSHCSTP